ncbi:MAG TPA: hypothetical protein VM575_05790 [Nocardioides sp.]|nr:hypothetical protein [Nocardioides sp.]
MRRMLGAYVAGVLAVVGVVAAPASAEDEPPQVQIVDAPGYIPIDAKPRLIGAVLAPTPGEDSVVLYEWDVDADGFDDGTSNAIIWNPAEHDLGSYTIQVRATVDGVQSTASAEIVVIAQFKVSLGTPATVTTGEQAFVGATVENFPWDSTRSYAWDLDGDGQFDDVADPTTEYVEPSWPTPGTYTIRVEVSHDQLADGAPPASASTTVTVLPRVGLTSAGITGTFRAGHLLTATGATPTPSDAVRTRTWLRDGTPIAGATGPTYKLTTSDSGRRISVRVNATHPDFGPALPVTKTVNVAAACTVRPTFTGTLRVGRRLSGSKGTWRAPSHTFAYRWLRDGRAITGATRSTYVTTRADRGHLITFQVTARRTGFPTVIAKSVARRIS